jgi:hypothetical protein
MAHPKQVLDFMITQKCFCLSTFWKFDDDHTFGFPITFNCRWLSPLNYVISECLAMNAEPNSFTDKSSTN